MLHSLYMQVNKKSNNGRFKAELNDPAMFKQLYLCLNVKINHIWQ